MADPVFCTECLNFEEGEGIVHPFGPPDHIHERCTSINNYRNSYSGANSKEISIPKIINKDNTCPWFESKSASSSSGGGIPPLPPVPYAEYFAEYDDSHTGIIKSVTFAIPFSNKPVVNVTIAENPGEMASVVINEVTPWGFTYSILTGSGPTDLAWKVNWTAIKV